MPKVKGSAYRGLQTCGSVWMCPVCASKVSERRRQELGEAVRRWQETGGVVLLVTFTVRHRAADDLRMVLEGLLKARKRLLAGKRAFNTRERFGIAGRVRALEVTWGTNGWHPHIHELVFLRQGIDRNAFLAELRDRWGQCVVAAGLRDVNDHGVDVRFADLSVADYVAKFGHERTWDVQHELTKQVTKVGKQGNLSPIGLLMASFEGDRAAGARWREYALVFKGCRQLSWSKGLRELLELDPERSDEEIAGEVREDAVQLAQLDRGQWRVVLGNDARAELLEVARTGDVTVVRSVLSSLGVDDGWAVLGLWCGAT